MDPTNRNDGDKTRMESLIAFKRAGAEGVLTYFAPRGGGAQGPLTARRAENAPSEITF